MWLEDSCLAREEGSLNWLGSVLPPPVAVAAADDISNGLREAWVVDSCCRGFCGEG